MTVRSRKNAKGDKTAENLVAESSTLLVDAPKSAKYQSFITRAFWSLVMIFSFLFAVIYTQQLGCSLLVFVLQAVMYKELVTLQISESIENDLPGFRFLYYYWFLIVSLYMYGTTLEPHFLMHSLKYSLGFNISSHISKFPMYCFLLYAFGLMYFVLQLRKDHYYYQFKQFAYCHITLLVVVVQSSFIISNMFEGLIWFLLPSSLVICNDIWAYLFGFFFGRTPLIELSPKKTWEGFLGGFAATIVWGFGFSKLLSHFSLMTCSKRGFQVEYWPQCDQHEIYKYVPIHDVFRIAPAFLDGVTVQPMDEHVLWFSIFASLVAPFGGFFASGFKRAFNIKDFGHSIPGHGGITDRMDCQIMMGIFVYVYYLGRIASKNVKVEPEEVVRLLMNLDNRDKLAVYNRFDEGLRKLGLLG